MATTTRLVVVLGLTGILASLTAGQNEPQPPEGVEVLTRGPVHEGFAEPTTQRQGPSPLVPKKPPEPIPELPSEQKPAGDNVIWIPGYWAWDDERSDFLWVSGVWRVPPPAHSWIPGYWQQVEGGWQWVSGYWSVTGENAVNLYPPPPEPVEEAIPPAPNADSTWAPGVWIYQQDQYWWRPGFWVGYQPGWIWMPASYYWTPGGYAFVNGHWDHDFDHRGLAFAPVYLDPRFNRRADWYYRPRYAIATDALLGSLFVHPGSNHYFFGDYYDPAYARRGYTPWVDHRIGKNIPDPLFSYYRHANRTNARWEENLRHEFTARRDGSMPRPARTFAQQEREFTEKKGKAPRYVTPLDHWQGKTFKLEAVPKAHAEQIHKMNEQWRQFSQERGRIEGQIKHPAPIKGKAVIPPRPARIELPRTAIQHPVTTRKPPTHPVQPKAAPHNPAPHKGKG